ncbi:hypothetical protein Nepgr_001885 [Nepenthes gracilis]|uniref:C3H1-type domain-containing protein n=1 Tax=Nepenthes gracilis TaxID=150966 RepID=A0AAD3P5U6_NEPGR|nr:hypothetical protein Nepgr_001885 [Nepenthes gracilis]
MLAGSEQINTEDRTPLSPPEMNNSTESCETEISFPSLLELAADNNVEGFIEYIECKSSAVDEIGQWYGCQVGSRRMVLMDRTPLMLSSLYGSVDVIKAILSLSKADVNRSCGPDKSTALHCAAAGGSINAVDAIKLLLLAGADPNLADATGHRPFDVINVSRMLPKLKVAIQDLLDYNRTTSESDLKVSFDGFAIDDSLCISTPSDCKFLPIMPERPFSPMTSKPNDTNISFACEKKEYPVDPSLPDIKNSIFATDEFRIYSFKVRPCSRAYSHDWTECPFVHPGENARRRDPRKFHYSCVPCPDFRKGSCRRGDLCEYAHGVFECWLHPAQYRTRLCKDGTSCERRVCFFAHTQEELRPLYVSAGPVVPSPRSAAAAAAAMDVAAALNLLPASPAAASGMSPPIFTPPISPSGNGMSHSSAAWPQQNIPTLHLPGSNIQTNNLQTSRLRSSVNARDIPAQEFSILHDLKLEQRQILGDMSCFYQSNFNPPSVNLSAHSKTLTPSNLDELFSSEISSPQYSAAAAAASSMVLNHVQQHQSMLSPLNTKNFSSKNVDHSFLQTPFGASSPGMMSPCGIEPQSPMSARISAQAIREKQQQLLLLRSLSSRDLGANISRDRVPDVTGMVGSPASPWSNWESSDGKLDWSVNGDDFGRLKRSYTIGRKVEEPDISWVQSLVKDSPLENQELQTGSAAGARPSGEGSNSNTVVETSDHSALGAWPDQLHLDQIVA